MSLIIGGHQRSGTTLLFQLCRRHPAIAITGEFRSFARLNAPYPEYVAALRTNWYVRGLVRNIGRKITTRSILAQVESAIFLARFLAGLRPFRLRRIGLDEVETILHRIFRNVLYVGDKNSGYVFRLPALASVPRLSRLIIYRDGRDVVSSMLFKLRGDWRHLGIAQELDTPEKVARRWVTAVERMERYREDLFILQYENLVGNPRTELDRLADWLKVERSGFRHRVVKSKSVGKHRHGLDPAETEAVLRVAGPTLQRLGYL